MARHDYGFPDLIAWLAARGWVMDDAIRRSRERIFMRQQVERTA